MSLTEGTVRNHLSAAIQKSRRPQPGGSRTNRAVPVAGLMLTRVPPRSASSRWIASGLRACDDEDAAYEDVLITASRAALLTWRCVPRRQVRRQWHIER